MPPTMTMEFDVTTEELLGLGGLFSDPPTALSPLAAAAPSAALIDSYRAKRLLDATGGGSADLRAVLEVLRCPAAVGRVRVLGAPVQMDAMTYVCAERAVAVTATATGFSVTAPAPVREIALSLAELCGGTSISAGRVNVAVSAREAIAVAALLDLQRTRQLVEAGAAVTGVQPLTPAGLTETLATGGPPLSLQAMVRHLLGAPEESDGELRETIGSKLVVRDGDSLVLSEPLAMIADRALLFDAGVLIEAYVDTAPQGGGRIVTAQVGALIAGAHAAIVIEQRTADTVEFSLVAPIDVVAIGERFLSDPAGLFDFTQLAVTETAAPPSPAAAVTETAAPPPPPAPVIEPAPVTETAPPPPPPAPAPVTQTTAPPPPPTAAVWAPTHRTPEAGLAAYAAPDPNGSPVARLDPRLPVQVTATLGVWGHIVCSNGWEAWVDGRYLEPLNR